MTDEQNKLIRDACYEVIKNIPTPLTVGTFKKEKIATYLKPYTDMITYIVLIERYDDFSKTLERYEHHLHEASLREMDLRDYVAYLERRL